MIPVQYCSDSDGKLLNIELPSKSQTCQKPNVIATFFRTCTFLSPRVCFPCTVILPVCARRVLLYLLIYIQEYCLFVSFLSCCLAFCLARKL